MIVMPGNIGFQTANPESLEKMGLAQIANVVVNAAGFAPARHRPNIAGQDQKTHEAANNLQILHRFVPPQRGSHRLVAKSATARKGLTPGRNRRPTFDHFRYSQPRTLGRVRRQRARLEEPTGDDFAVRVGQAIPAEVPDKVDRDVVAAGDVAVEEQTVQRRLAREFDSSLLGQLAPQRVAKCFADFDAAPRQMPAGDVAVLDQKHAVVAVQHYGADPERHAAGETPIQMKNPPQQRLKPLSQILQVHRDRTLENPDTAFDPCAGTDSLPRDSMDS